MSKVGWLPRWLIVQIRLTDGRTVRLRVEATPDSCTIDSGYVLGNEADLANLTTDECKALQDDPVLIEAMHERYREIEGIDR